MFPYTENIQIEGKSVHYQQILDMLTPFTTDERKQKIDRVLDGRTFNVGVVTEKICDTGNVAAVIRSMENLGFQKLDVIESEKIKISSRVTNGAHKWVEQRKWSNAADCIKAIKAEGYQMVGTALTADSVPMTEIDFTIPTVICLGNEKDGVSEELLAACDKNCIIPTSGFSQSFNISVAAAILLSYIKLQREERLGKHGDLTDHQKDILRALYYLKSCKTPNKYFQ